VILVLFGFFNQRLRDRIQESMMKVTDHTLGVIFGIIRGIVLMGLIYWGALWYYSDAPVLPDFVSAARSRPVMQLTVLKIQEWFVPGENKLLERDMTGAKEAEEIYNNLINPAVQKTSAREAEKKSEEKKTTESEHETGYKNSERAALENQLLQIETAARAEEKSRD
jgi:uncharacterized membrane protein required for colicin V production